MHAPCPPLLRVALCLVLLPLTGAAQATPSKPRARDLGITLTGADGIRVFALPQDRLVKAMRGYGRLKASPGPTPAKSAPPPRTP